MSTKDTLYLDPDAWDLSLDVDGNIAYAKPPYAVAQDVGSAVKLFSGELYYDTEKGIPYFDETLGKKQSFSLYQKRLVDAAMSVTGVEKADAGIESEDNRVISAIIKITDSENNTNQIEI